MLKLHLLVNCRNQFNSILEKVLFTHNLLPRGGDSIGPLRPWPAHITHWPAQASLIKIHF